MEITRQVKWSKESVFITIVAIDILLVCLVGCLFFCRQNMAVILTLCSATAVIALAAFYYSPVAIEVNDEALVVKKRIGTKTIPLSSIESVAAFTPIPMLRNQRVCGSGGLAGYWGWFKEPGVGLYFAYYGNNEDCFLLRLKNGRQYVLGCQDSEPVIAYLSEHIANKQ